MDNKRGQEGVTLTTILLMILGIVVVVLVILFATGFFDKVNNATDSAGSKLDVAAKACEIAGSQELKADYCQKFREIEVNGQSIYATCEYSAIQNVMDKTVSSTFSTLCSGVTPSSAKEYCTNEKLSGKQLIAVGNSEPAACSTFVTSA
ncbi:MAG TPA: hypothetical protein VHA12_00590 [Candidatus Nanoarchaeia archaeon]|nr:hypothetical protein [Candidatus Nanoarchaeia archaeon]